MNYTDFTIGIQDAKTLEVGYQGKTFLLENVEFDPIAMLTVERMNAWITFGLKQEEATSGRENPLTVDDLKAIGLNLYRILFFDNVRKRFTPAYEEFEKAFAKNTTLRFRLRLVFTRAAERLSRLPWEFLYIPTGDAEQDGFFFTGEKTQLILTRSVPPSPSPAQLKTSSEGLRILVVLSSPKIPGAIQLSPEQIDKLLIAMKNLKNTDVEVLRGPDSTISSLNAKFGPDRFNPHIVHFIGHGDKGRLAFVKAKDEPDYDEGGDELQPRWVTGQQLRKCVQNWEPRPRLIFLQACRGAAADAHDTFNSCARELVFADVPVVAAMQYSVSNSDAQLFATTFYEELGRGHDVDEAVKAGRLKLGTVYPYWEHPRFGTPVVYLQADAGPIVLAAIAPEPSAAQTVDSAAPPAASRVGTPIGGATTRRTAEVANAPAGEVEQTRTGFGG